MERAGRSISPGALVCGVSGKGASDGVEGSVINYFQDTIPRKIGDGVTMTYKIPPRDCQIPPFDVVVEFIIIIQAK